MLLDKRGDQLVVGSAGFCAAHLPLLSPSEVRSKEELLAVPDTLSLCKLRCVFVWVAMCYLKVVGHFNFLSEISSLDIALTLVRGPGRCRL